MWEYKHLANADDTHREIYSIMKHDSHINKN